MTFDLAVVGLGYVGLPLAVAAGRAGLRVLGMDVDPAVVQRLSSGESHIADVADAEVAAALAAAFDATTDPLRLAEADAISICVPTPWHDRQPDLRYVESAAAAVGDNLRRGQLVVVESTTYPGTTEDVVVPILEARSGLVAGRDFQVAYSPQRIDPANREFGLHNTPKLVAGIDSRSTERAVTIYRRFCGEVVEMSGTREAEMAKLLENTYRHVNIAMVNEIALICHELDIDVWEVVRGAAAKPFGFQSFRPGPGVGGHCIPVDPRYLAYRVAQHGGEVRTIESAQTVNAQMILHVVQRVISMLNDVGKPPMGAKVLLAGVADKPNVADVRETPATHIASLLCNMGADLSHVDPHVPAFEVGEVSIERRHDALTASQAADLVIVLATHAEFELNDMAKKANLFFDTSGRVDPAYATRL